MKKRLSLKIVGVGLISLVLFVYVVRVMTMVREGHAADTYTNVKGMHIGWGAAAVTIVVSAIAMICALIIRARYRSAERDSAVRRDRKDE